MNKFIKICNILFIIIAISLTSGCDSTTNDTDALKVGVCADYPPFEFIVNGKLQGFDIELAEAISKELNKKIKFYDMNFDSIIISLQSGKIDLAISSINETPERKNNIDFSDPYYESKVAIIYLKDKNITKENFVYKKIGAQLGSTLEQISNTFHNEKVVALPKLHMLIQELKLQRVNVVICEQKQAIEFCKANDNLDYFTIDVIANGYAIGLAKNSILKNDINNILNKFKENGTLNNLQKKWL